MKYSRGPVFAVMNDGPYGPIEQDIQMRFLNTRKTPFIFAT